MNTHSRSRPPQQNGGWIGTSPEQRRAAAQRQAEPRQAKLAKAPLPNPVFPTDFQLPKPQ